MNCSIIGKIFSILIFFPLLVVAQNVEITDEYLEEIYPDLEKLYIHLHENPELALQEVKTSELMAQNLKKLGFAIIKDLGATNLAGVLENGPGPVVLIRTDLDALPLTENTGLPYASKARGINAEGNEVGVMHACGHDIHMTVFNGVARTLVKYKDKWSGTLVMVGQCAEETGMGADLLFKNGLYSKIPKPDYALALHSNSYFETGKVALRSGPALATMDMIDITVHGKGGHGAAPHNTIDPIVLSSQIVESFQTIVSREINPLEPALITVGSFHGGTVHNIIPDVVKMQLTVRSFSMDVRNHIMEALQRKCDALALAAGLPKDKFPLIEVREPFTPATVNDPALTEKLVNVFNMVLGSENVIEAPQYTIGEDFSRFGLQPQKVPICLFWLGTVDPKKMDGRELPSLHSALFTPLPEPSIKTGIKAMGSAALDLFNN